MSSNYAIDLSRSKKAFQGLVWPELNKFLKGKLDIVEGSQDKRDFDMDTQSGVDYWWVENGAGRTGLSSRVQADDGRRGFPYNTFTIRRSRITGTRTEYQKLVEARKNRRLYPALMIQSYITAWDDGELISFALAYTDSILDYIAKGKAGIKPTSNADFFYIPFNAVAHYQYPKPTSLSMSTDRLPRDSIIGKINQSHLNPGMNLARLNQLFIQYGIKELGDWDKLSIEQLKEMLALSKGAID